MIIHYNILGCWSADQPVLEASIPDLDCVFGRANQDGKWTTSNCVSNVAGTTIDDDALDAATPAKFGCVLSKPFQVHFCLPDLF